MEKWEEVYCVLAGEWDGTAVISGMEEACGGSEVYETAHKNLADARDRLCERFSLNTEDEDLEEIMNAVLKIEKNMAGRAFLCGYREGCMACGKEGILP